MVGRAHSSAPWAAVTPTVWTAVMTILAHMANGLSIRGEPAAFAATNTGTTYTRDLRMPGVSPKEHDAYICAAFPVNSTLEEWVIRYDPLSSADRVHHMLLFGCSGVDQKLASKGFWDCGHHGVCQGGRIMYAWAKNAPATSLPPDVGFRIGGQTDIKYLTLQIHYANPIEEGQTDNSGLRMSLTTTTQKYKAGIYLLAGGWVDIPPHTEKTSLDMNCRLRDTEPNEINLFAYRTHAHSLGSVITGYKYDEKSKQYTEIAKGNPQWPQAFYPMDKVQNIKMDDILHARCTWNSTNRDRHTYIGSTGDDEMCNLYLMYYTDVDKGSESGGCGYVQFQDVLANLPADSDVPLPPNPLLEEHAKGHNDHQEKEKVYQTISKSEPIEVEKKGHSHKKPEPGIPQRNPVTYDDYSTANEAYPPPPPPALPPRGHMSTQDTSSSTILHTHRKDKQLKPSAYSLVSNWGPKDIQFGQVVAVATDSKGDVIVFHRGERQWDGAAFVGDSLRDTSNPIQQSTLLHLNKETGQIKDQWGENFFFMPHGLTVDLQDNIWVTDVGMHQVFKFAKGYANSQPLITLGTRFEPGSDDTHFCKPTAVAVLTSGEFFVSDGYCNSRVIKYSADGKTILLQFGEASGAFAGIGIGSPAPSTFSIPHGLTLAEDQGEVCVADRENGRVQCFTVDTGKFTRQFQFDGWGGRLFAVSYTPAMGGKLFAVNGPQYIGQMTVQAFEVDFSSGQLIGSFSPDNQGLSNPHDIIVSADGVDVYIVEIGPNKLWKFELDSVLNAASKNPTVSSLPPKLEVKTEKLLEGAMAVSYDPYQAHWSRFSVSTIVLSMMAVPIVVLTSLTLIIRARRTGRFKMRNMGNGVMKSNGRHNKHDNGLNLGSLLNKHHGFEKLATEDLDHDGLDSGDSDIEEFSQVATRAM
ncbi:unnamed protein product, partial [Meganyctiphanes norvegica]